MSQSSTSDSSLTQLQEELSFNEALLASLEDQKDVEEQREEVSDTIQSLQQQIARMQQPLPDWGWSNNDSYPQLTHNAVGLDDLDPYSRGLSYFNPSQTRPVQTNMTLPSRKRPRNDFDDEFEQLSAPNVKAHRTPTPREPSPARSIDSFGTDISDDPILRKLLGGDYKEEKRNTEHYLRELETRKRQEEEDAEFARQLEASWRQNSPSMADSVKPAAVQLSNYSQSFLRPDGSSFQKPVAKKPDLGVKVEDRYRPPVISVPASGTSTPSSEDSGLMEISANDWTNKFGSSQRRSLPYSMSNGYSSTNANSMRMPGSFPNLTGLYASTPGSSVYGNSPYTMSQYNSSTSSLNKPYSVGKNSLFNGPLAGTQGMPFDLDRYPLPPSLSYPDPEQTQEEIKDLLKHIRPDEELTAEQLAEIQPEGLKINLMPHQRKGYAWMKSMEEGSNKGGILADDMGLGKTVQALALILGRPPPDGDDGRKVQKPTLIVAPLALMQQWEREINKFVRRSHHLNVLILHGSNRNLSWNDIKSYDVVLTTYGLLASDLKRKSVWDKHVKLVHDARPQPQQQSPVLGDKSKFHRVILDEAQNIKNKSTKAAVAACKIQADYRWCLSGTPMQNNIDEIFSLIKFCRIRPYNDFDKFSKDIGRPIKSKQNYGLDRAMKQLQALLRAVLLRRTKKSEIDGQPIIQLPEKHTIEDRAVFNKDERDFYKALETNAQIQFNRYLKNGTVGRNYSHALVLLLRLRQCCCSPQLITNAKDFLINGALQDLDYVENAKYLPKDVVKRLANLDAFECPICMDGVENPIIFNPCGHSLCQECLSTMVDKAMADTENRKVTCPHCRAAVDTNKVTDRDSFLRVHFPDHPDVKPLKEEVEGSGDEADVTDDDSSDDEAEDDSDDGADLRDFIVPDDEYVEEESNGNSAADRKPVKKSESSEDVKKLHKSSLKANLAAKKLKATSKKAKGKKKSKPDTRTLAQLRVEGMRNIAAKKKYLRRLGRGFQPSTKIEKTIQLLKDIRDNGQGEKTIIFSSFTSFLDLLEVAINRDDDDVGTYTRYDGSMSNKDRNDAVTRFTDDPRCKSILVSLKAGNAGLNLTTANHVIILDPFWNPFVEYQAADRCYRIGQQREVTIHRVLIGKGDEDGNLIEDSNDANADAEYTVEDRILALQEKKRHLVETALDETASGNIGRLGVRELGYLFGVNNLDS